jgi:hypothetical protein
MREVVEMIGVFAIIFAISVSVSYFLVSVKVRVSLPKPLEGGVIQVRSGNSMYRSRFVRSAPNGWVIHAPLSRDSYVPLRVGEALTVVMPTDAGLRQFETEILLRDSATHELTVSPPHRMTVVERRQSNRIKRFEDSAASIEGRAATLIDLSEGGARLETSEPLLRGERAVLDLPSRGRVFGWVLESSQSALGHTLRLRFEEPLKM